MSDHLWKPRIRFYMDVTMINFLADPNSVIQKIATSDLFDTCKIIWSRHELLLNIVHPQCYSVLTMITCWRLWKRQTTFLAIDSSVIIICFLYEWQFWLLLVVGHLIKGQLEKFGQLCYHSMFWTSWRAQYVIYNWKMHYQAVCNARGKLRMNASIARRPDGTHGPQQLP